MSGAGIMTAASGILGAYGSMTSAQNSADQLRAEAKDAVINAQQTQLETEYNAEKQMIMAKKNFGSQAADYAASGIASDSISALDVLRESTMNAELDRQNILYSGAVRQQNYLNRANAAGVGAGKAMEAGKINAYSSLLGAGAKISDRYGGSDKTANGGASASANEPSWFFGNDTRANSQPVRRK
jgi:hypothetical protein